MNTDDLESPFEEQAMDGSLDVAGRSVVLLRELIPEEVTLREAEVAEQPHTEESSQPEPQPEPALEPVYK